MTAKVSKGPKLLSREYESHVGDRNIVALPGKVSVWDANLRLEFIGFVDNRNAVEAAVAHPLDILCEGCSHHGRAR